jgi:hypothetical protein
MVRIHLVTGNKGNVGKSLWASGLIEYYRSYGRELTSIDGDKDSKTLRSTYKDSLIIVLSDDPIMSAQPDMIMDIAEESSKSEGSGDVLIDLPAGGEKTMNAWMESCGLHKSSEIADILPVTIFKWWVSDADLESVSLFEKSVDAYPDIKHIFVKNMGRSREVQWEQVYSETSLKLLKDSQKIKVIDMDVLAPETIRLTRSLRIELKAASSHEKVPLSKRLRVRSWLKTTAAKIDYEVLLSKEKAQESPPDRAVKEKKVVVAKK